jgi:hypothetical protein
LEIYKAEKEVVDVLHRTREKIASCCRPYLNRPVRIQTIDGETHECMIVDIDRHHLYVQPLQQAHTHGDMFRPHTPYGAGYPGVYPGNPYVPGQYGPGPFGPYGPYGPSPAAGVVLPLALYSLLAIALL